MKSNEISEGPQPIATAYYEYSISSQFDPNAPLNANDWTPFSLVSGADGVSHTVRDNNNYWIRFRIRTDAGLTTDGPGENGADDFGGYLYYHVMVNMSAPNLTPAAHYHPAGGSYGANTVEYEILSGNTLIPKRETDAIDSDYVWQIQYVIMDDEGERPQASDWLSAAKVTPADGGEMNKAGTLYEAGRTDATAFLPGSEPKYVYFRVKLVPGGTQESAAPWHETTTAMILVTDQNVPKITVTKSDMTGTSAAWDPTAYYSKLKFTLTNAPVLPNLSVPLDQAQPSGTFYYYYLDATGLMNDADIVNSLADSAMAGWTQIPNLDDNSNNPGVLDLTGNGEASRAAIAAFIAANGGKANFDGVIWFVGISGANVGREAQSPVVSRDRFNFRFENAAGVTPVDPAGFLDGDGDPTGADTGKPNWTNKSDEVVLDLSNVWAGAYNGAFNGVGSGVKDFWVAYPNGAQAEIIINGVRQSGYEDLLFTAPDAGVYRFHITTKAGFTAYADYEVVRIDKLGQVFNLAVFPDYPFNGSYGAERITFLVQTEGSVDPNGAENGAYTAGGAPKSGVTYQYATLPYGAAYNWPAEDLIEWTDFPGGSSLSINESRNTHYRIRAVTGAGTAVDYGSVLNHTGVGGHNYTVPTVGAPYYRSGSYLVRLDLLPPELTIAYQPADHAGYRRVADGEQVYIVVDPGFTGEVGTMWVKAPGSDVAQTVSLDSVSYWAGTDEALAAWDGFGGNWEVGAYEPGMKIRFNVKTVYNAVGGSYTFYSKSLAGMTGNTEVVDIENIDTKDPEFTVSSNIAKSLINANWIDNAVFFTIAPQYTSQQVKSRVQYFYELYDEDSSAWARAEQPIKTFNPGDAIVSFTLDVDADLIGPAGMAADGAQGFAGKIRFLAVASSVRDTPDSTDGAAVVYRDRGTWADEDLDLTGEPFDLRVDHKTPTITIAAGDLPTKYETGTFDLRFSISFGLSDGTGSLSVSAAGTEINGAIAVNTTSGGGVVPMNSLSSTDAYLFGIAANGRYTFTLYSGAANKYATYILDLRDLSGDTTVPMEQRVDNRVMDNIDPRFTVRAQVSNGAWNSYDSNAFYLTLAQTPVSGVKYQVQLGEGAEWRDLTDGELIWMQLHDGEFPFARTDAMRAEIAAVDGAAAFPDVLNGQDGFNGAVRFRAYKGAAARQYAAEDDANAFNPANIGDSAVTVRIDRHTPELEVADPHGWWETGAYYLEFDCAFGEVNASSAANIITQVFNGVSTQVTLTLQEGKYVWAVTRNGDYTFIARSESGMEATFKLEGDTAVKWIDAATTLSAPTVSMYVGGAPTAYAPNAWYDRDVEFRLTVPNSAVPASGVYYQYRVQSGGGWGAWTDIPDSGADNGSLYSAVFGADADGLFNIEFRAFPGRVYTPGSPNEGSALANVDAWMQANSIEPVGRTVGVDKVPLTVYLKDVTEYNAYGWTTGAATVQVQVVTGESGAAGGIEIWTYSTLNYTPALRASAAASVVPGDGSAVRTNDGTVVQIGQYLLTYAFDVNGDAAYYAAGGVIYSVYAAVPNGGARSAAQDKNIEINRIESPETPTISVLPTNAATPGNPNRWTTEGVSFALEAENESLSGVTFMRREATGYADDGETLLWGEWTENGGASRQYAATDTQLYVQFGLARNSDKSAVVSISDTYGVLISTQAPVIGAVNPLDATPGVWTTGSVTLEITVDFHGFGAGTWAVAYSANGITYGNYVLLGELAYEVFQNGDYKFRATSASNIVSEETVVHVTQLENSSAVQFTVTAVGLPTGENWTRENVTFTVTLNETSMPASKAYIQYQMVEEGQDAAATPWQVLTSPDTGAGYAAFKSLPIDWSFNGNLTFRAYTGSMYVNNGGAAAGEWASVSTGDTYRVRIDKAEPTISVTGNPTAWTKDPVELTVNVNLPQLKSGATWTVSKDGGPAAALGTNTVYTAAANGTYVFTVTSGTGYTATDTVTVNRIIPASEGPNLLARINGADYEDWQSAVNAQSFKSDVTVALKLKEGVATTWTVKNEKGEDVKGVTFTDNVQVFSKNGNYMITLTDEAGNETTLFFTIAKPNYAMIAVGSVLGVAAMAAIGFLVFINIRNKKALQRLISQTGQSDESNKFLMFKKIK
jgi:hypothetical protein